MSFTLSRDRRVRKRRDFTFIQRRGARGHAEHLTISGMRRKPGTGRIGLTVSKKVGNAPARNKLKRRLREILRVRPALFADYDLVLIAKPGASDLSFEQLTAEVLRAHSGLLKSLKKAKRPKPSVRQSGRRDKT